MLQSHWNPDVVSGESEDGCTEMGCGLDFGPFVGRRTSVGCVVGVPVGDKGLIGDVDQPCLMVCRVVMICDCFHPLLVPYSLYMCLKPRRLPLSSEVLSCFKLHLNTLLDICTLLRLLWSI